MNKILFETKLTGHNKYLRDFVMSKIKKYKTPTNCEALEIGIGNGRFGSLIGSKFRKYCGIDPDEEYVKIALKSRPKKDFLYKTGKAENIPFKKKFDILVYPFSWHFIKDFKLALSEASRVIKNDGIILILDPRVNSESWADSRLNRNSGEFNKKLYSKKMEQLKRGSKIIRRQKLFYVEEFETDRFNLWILKKVKIS